MARKRRSGKSNSKHSKHNSSKGNEYNTNLSTVKLSQSLLRSYPIKETVKQLNVEASGKNAQVLHGQQILSNLTILFMSYYLFADIHSRGLGTSNGRFISLLDSIDSCMSFRNRLPPAPPQIEDTSDINRSRVSKLQGYKRQGSVFYLRSNKNSTGWYIYVWFATFMLKFLGGTLVSIFLYRTPVLFKGARHYISFSFALFMVQFSPDDAVYRTFNKSLAHRLILGTGMSFYKYRKISFAVNAAIDQGHEIAVIVFFGWIVVELNSLIRNAENHLTHWPLYNCMLEFPIGFIRAITSINTILACAASFTMYVGICFAKELGSLSMVANIVALLCMWYRYNRKHLSRVGSFVQEQTYEGVVSTVWDIVDRLKNFSIAYAIECVQDTMYAMLANIVTLLSTLVNGVSECLTSVYYVTTNYSTVFHESIDNMKFRLYQTRIFIQSMLDPRFFIQLLQQTVLLALLVYYGKTIKLVWVTTAILNAFPFIKIRNIGSSVEDVISTKWPWLTYFVVQLFFVLLEPLLLSNEISMHWLFLFIKFSFLLWCGDPDTNGCGKLQSTFIQPYLKKLKSE